MRRIAVLIAALSSTHGLAQEPCTACENTGLVACTRHGDAAVEVDVIWCSALATCRTCEGAGAVACGECDVGSDELAGRRARSANALAEVRRELGELADETVTVELDRVRVTVGIDRKFSFDGRSLDAHQLAHECARIVAAVRADFVSTFELTDDDFPRHDTSTTADPERLVAGAPSPLLRLVLLRDATPARRAARRIVGLDLQGIGVLRLGARSVGCLHLDPGAVGDAADLRRLCAAVSARLLVAQVAGSPGDAGHGWLEAGIAHAFEARFGGDRNAFLGFGELVLAPATDYVDGDWSSAARELASRGRLRSVAELAALQHEELDFEARAQSRLLVEFLLEKGQGPRLLAALRSVLEGKEPGEVLRTAYPDLDDLDARFAAWLDAR